MCMRHGIVQCMECMGSSQGLVVVCLASGGVGVAGGFLQHLHNPA